MDYYNGFILQKTMVSSNRSVDWSLLNAGMTIPVSECALLKALSPKEELQRVFVESSNKKES